LGVEKIGVRDNFFKHGGDSLLAVKTVTRIREELNTTLHMKDFFSNPSIAELAIKIEAGEAKQERIPKAPQGVVIPLSFAQERLWFLQQLDSDSRSYYVPRALRLIGQTDPALIQATFAEITRRHSILRTAFPSIDGQPVQRIMEPFQFHLTLIDMTDTEESIKTQRVRQWLQKEGQKGFHLEKGPPIRVTLLKLNREEHILVSTEHHLVHDGWAQGVLLKEFIAIFSAYVRGETSPMPELPIQYADFTYWQRNYLKGDVLANHLAY
ncbi:MAG: non-ribosomal peptide synthetase, partial [bacterium]|nr:non-ribosomal peptide synthetase [bacterium]